MAERQNGDYIDQVVPRRIRIIKLGGSAITNKQQFETLNSVNLESFLCELKQILDEDKAMSSDSPTGTILIHGAGSFGHFQAKDYSLAQGRTSSESLPLVGFSKTRESVRKLLALLMEGLLRFEIPAVALSPFPSWITCYGKNIVQSSISEIRELISMGFVVVMHGDVVIDHSQYFTILSGDLIANYLSEQLSPAYVTFLTDVFGVYDRPPTEKDAKLLETIELEQADGIPLCNPIFTCSLQHDVTGGMSGKLDNSIEIARRGIPVFIAKAGSPFSLAACKGIKPTKGTHIYQKRKTKET